MVKALCPVCDWYYNANDNSDDNNIIFNIKDTALCAPVVTLSARENQKLSKRLSKGFERSVYWNEYNTKYENKNTTNYYKYFLKSNFVGVNRLFVLVYANEANNTKRFNAQKYYLPKGIIKNYNVMLETRLEKNMLEKINETRLTFSQGSVTVL